MTLTKGSKKQATATHRVLVVEDDADTQRGVMVYLRSCGYEVFASSRGDQAVALIQKLKPHVVILDLGLPGMDGIQVLKTLSIVQPDTQCIVLSAWDESRFEDEALSAGAFLYLEKPIAGDQLLDAVSHALDQKR